MVIDKIIRIGLFPAILIQSMLPRDVADIISPDCLFSMLFDIDCFGCGMGRALQALLHLDLQSALGFNKLAPIVLLVLAALFLFGLKDLLSKNKFPEFADYKSDTAH